MVTFRNNNNRRPTFRNNNRRPPFRRNDESSKFSNNDNFHRKAPGRNNQHSIAKYVTTLSQKREGQERRARGEGTISKALYNVRHEMNGIYANTRRLCAILW